MKSAITPTFSDSALASQLFDFAQLKFVLIEPVMVLGAALFWVVALPFVALSLMLVKIWDTLLALKSGTAVRPNPLILRRGLTKSSLAVRGSARAAQI